VIERLYVYMFIFHDIKYNFLLLKVKGAPQKWLSFLKFILESECAVVSLESKLRASWQKTSTSRGSTSSGGAEDRCSGGYLFKRLQLLKNYPISPITIGARRVSKIRKFCILELRRFLHFYLFYIFFQLCNFFNFSTFFQTLDFNLSQAVTINSCSIFKIHQWYLQIVTKFSQEVDFKSI